MTSESDRLLSTGAPVVVAGGEVRLRFTLLAIKRCEDAYGSMRGIVDELGWLAEQAANDFPEPVAGRVAALLGHILGSGEVDADSTPAACIDALLDAWMEAFPPAEDADPKATGATGHSPGTTGGGSPALSVA